MDFLVATLANEDFKNLYQITDVVTYAKFKDAVFARYRTMAEILGVLLVREVRENAMSCLVETSGRDVAMFDYIDYFFPSETYNKLVVHFSINDITFAERSVETRMLGELAAGSAAFKSGSVVKMIQANAGGPYGASQLRGGTNRFP